MGITVIDIETTGLSKYYHKITEIAAAKIENGKITERFQMLINPRVEIPRFITRLTGIDNEMVRDAPRIEEVLPRFLHFLGDDVFVAHNATFDFGFLDFNVTKHLEFGLPNKRLCTRKLANRLFPHLHRRRLIDLCELFGIRNNQAHRAFGDVEATVGVFTNIVRILGDRGIFKESDIFKFEKSPLRKLYVPKRNISLP